MKSYKTEITNLLQARESSFRYLHLASSGHRSESKFWSRIKTCSSFSSPTRGGSFFMPVSIKWSSMSVSARLTRLQISIIQIITKPQTKSQRVTQVLLNSQAKYSRGMKYCWMCYFRSVSAGFLIRDHFCLATFSSPSSAWLVVPTLFGWLNYRARFIIHYPKTGSSFNPGAQTLQAVQDYYDSVSWAVSSNILVSPLNPHFSIFVSLNFPFFIFGYNNFFFTFYCRVIF